METCLSLWHSKRGSRSEEKNKEKSVTKISSRTGCFSIIYHDNLGFGRLLDIVKHRLGFLKITSSVHHVSMHMGLL